MNCVFEDVIKKVSVTSDNIYLKDVFISWKITVVTKKSCIQSQSKVARLERVCMHEAGENLFGLKYSFR